MSTIVNERLRSWIEYLGLSQTEVARRTGLGQSTVSQHLAGTRQLAHVETIRGYAKLGIPIEDLLPTESESE